MLLLGKPWFGVTAPAAARSWFCSWCAGGIRVASMCVDDAEDSAALSGFVGFFMAAMVWA
jgi:hypothetical protein